MLKIASPIALAILLWSFVATPSPAQTATNAADASAISIPVESLPQTDEQTDEQSQMERRLAQAACRALKSGVLTDALVARVETSLANRGLQGDVLALTTGFVDEALTISTDEICLVR